MLEYFRIFYTRKQFLETCAPQGVLIFRESLGYVSGKNSYFY